MCYVAITPQLSTLRFIYNDAANLSEPAYYNPCIGRTHDASTSAGSSRGVIAASAGSSTSTGAITAGSPSIVQA